MGQLPFGLTQKEAEVLRLVDRTRTSDEIASIVGRSTSTVNHQIKSARRRMGNLTRFQAAERFREAERDSQRSPNLPQTIPQPERPPQFVSTEDERSQQITSLAAVREERSTYEAPVSAPVEETVDDPAGLNTSPVVTILLIVAIAAAIMIVILTIPALTSSAGQLTQLIRSQT